MATFPRRRWLPTLVLVGILAGLLGAATSSTLTLIQDGFDDGGYTDGPDPADVTWNWTGGDAFLSVVSDAKLDPDGSGHRVLKAEDATERDEYLYASFNRVKLEVGQGLRFRGRVRLGQPPRDKLSRFGVALIDVNKSIWTAAGYSLNVNLGQGEINKPDVRFLREVNTQPVNINKEDLVLGEVSGYAGQVGTEPFTFVLEVRRKAEAEVEVGFRLNDRKEVMVTDRTDPTAGPPVVQFGTVTFRTDQVDGKTGGTFFFDQVVVERFDLGGAKER